MKKVLFILLGLAAAGVLGLVAMCQYTGAKLKPYVEEMMVDCDAGRYQQAYDRAGDAGKAQWSFEAFETYMQAVKQKHGAFKGLGSVKGFRAHTSAGSASTAGITVELQFEQGSLNGKFDFVKIDDLYKWTDLQIPAKGSDHADPEQLQPTATELIQLFADGQLVALYERFTPELKSAWPAEKYQAQMTPLREALGELQETTYIQSETVEGGERVEMQAVFANGTKSVSIKLIDRDGTWQPLAFMIGNK